MANRYIKRCSASAIIMEMQMKTTMRCHLTPARMAGISKRGVTSAGEDVEKRGPCVLLECKSGQSLWRTAWRLLKQLKMKTYHAMQQFHCGEYVQRKHVTASERYWHPIFTAELCIVAKTRKQPKGSSVDDWIKKM